MATLETLLSQQMIERLGWTLIHFVWQAATVALLLAAGLRGLRRSSSNVRYVVACMAMALIVALPLVTMSLVEVSRPVAEAGPILNPPPVMRTTLVEVVELPREPFDAPVPQMPERVTHIPWTQRIATALEPALPWLVVGWLLGVFGLSAWHLGGWAQLQRMKRRLVSEVAAPLHARAAELAGRLGIRRAIGLWASPLIDVPAVVGWIKPVILLPVGAVTGLSVEQLEAILAHELAHVRRCDYLVNLVQTVVEILGFYHPAVWWISHRIRDERENCCDDLAVQVCGDSRRYARALTCLEELRHVARASRPHATEERARAGCPRHTAVAASGGSLVDRIARLLGRPPIDHRRFAWLPGLIALLLVAALLIPTALLIAAPNAPTRASPEANSTGQVGSRNVERTRFAHRNVEERVDREFGFEQLIREEGEHWIVAMPYSTQSVGKMRCRMCADRGEQRFDGALNQPAPDGGTFRGNVVIEITSSEPNSIDACTLYLDKVTFSAQNKRFTSSAPVRLVAGATELAGRGLELSFDEPQDRSDPSRLTVIDGVGVRITPSGSLIVSLGNPKTESSEASASRQPVSVRVLTEKADGRASSLDEKPTVMLDIELIKFLTDRPLRPEAATQLSRLWDQVYARQEIGRGQRASLPRADELEVSPRALLERCTENAQGDSEALEILVDLLASHQHLKVVMNPRVEVFDGQQAQVMSKQYVPNPTAQPGAPEAVECRDLVTVTPRIDSAGHITLDLAAEICDVILNDSKTPRVSKHRIDTKAVVDENKTFVCRLESAAEGETQDNGVLYLLAHPRIVRPASSREPATVTATFVDTDLIEALSEISEQTQAKIAVDPTVKPERITARLSGASVDMALQTVLQDTAATSKKLGDTNTYIVFHPLSGTFQGTDLREALRQVAEQAGVNITWDATVGGEAWADFEGVSLETALRMLLAGSPYVATRTPDGYAVTKRNVQPPTSPSRRVDAVAVEARLLLVDPDCLEALRRGLPIQGVTTPADVNALHEIGADLTEGRTPLLKPDRVELLLRAVGQYAGSKMLAAPKVTVRDGESASVSLANHIQYISGYREPNDLSQDPIPQHASKEIGMRLDATPHLIEDQNNIRLQFEIEITSLLGMQKALYGGKYEYDVPTFTAVATATEIVVADGQTALIHIGETPSVGNILSDESEPAGPLLMLIKPSRTKAEPLDPAPAMQRERRPGDPGMGGGMGGLPPGRPPFPPPLSS